MANIQELMMAMILTERPEQTMLFRATITPKRGKEVTCTFRAKDAATARARIQKAAKRKFPHGFSFAVRPL